MVNAIDLQKDYIIFPIMASIMVQGAFTPFQFAGFGLFKPPRTDGGSGAGRKYRQNWISSVQSQRLPVLGHVKSFLFFL